MKRWFKKQAKTYRILTAIVVAIAFHGLLFVIPFTQQSLRLQAPPSALEVHLTYSEIIPDTPEPEPAPAPEIELEQEAPPRIQPVAEEITPMQPAPPVAEIIETPQEKVVIEDMTPQQKSRITDVILSRQFISAEPPSDNLFSVSPNNSPQTPTVDFRIPQRRSLVEIMDQPMEDLPFACQPGLVRFSYDPGVKGDLQRFWDRITPEFGGFTKSGTEVRCRWVLIVVGCGWRQRQVKTKRPE